MGLTTDFDYFKRWTFGIGVYAPPGIGNRQYGIRRDTQRKLVGQGYRLRLYVPYGTAWYPYFMRRLAERPANVFFLARNLLR